MSEKLSILTNKDFGFGVSYAIEADDRHMHLMRELYPNEYFREHSIMVNNMRAESGHNRNIRAFVYDTNIIGLKVLAQKLKEVSLTEYTVRERQPMGDFDLTIERVGLKVQLIITIDLPIDIELEEGDWDKLLDQLEAIFISPPTFHNHGTFRPLGWTQEDELKRSGEKSPFEPHSDLERLHEAADGSSAFADRPSLESLGVDEHEPSTGDDNDVPDWGNRTDERLSALYFERTPLEKALMPALEDEDDDERTGRDESITDPDEYAELEWLHEATHVNYEPDDYDDDDEPGGFGRDYEDDDNTPLKPSEVGWSRFDGYLNVDVTCATRDCGESITLSIPVDSSMGGGDNTLQQEVEMGMERAMADEGWAESNAKGFDDGWFCPDCAKRLPKE